MAKRKKIQKDKQRYTKHTHKTKDRVTRGGELRVSNSCSSSGTRRAILVTNPVISYFLMKWRSCLLCTRPICLNDLFVYNTTLLNKIYWYRHVA